jgi:uncharacterized protein (DUF427 family)
MFVAESTHYPSKMKTGTAKATVGSTTIAEATHWHEVEGNVYFPPESIKKEFFSPTELHTTCSWKGEASYYSVTVGGEFSASLDADRRFTNNRDW